MIIFQQNNISVYLIRWAIIFCCSLTGIYFAFSQGIVSLILSVDNTGICIAIFSLYILYSIIVGLKIYFNNKESIFFSKFFKQQDSDTEWFMSDIMTMLGMIGTVIGLISSLYFGLTQIDIADPEKMLDALVVIANGVGVALFTTLVGLVASVLLKLQLIVLDHNSKVNAL